MLFRSLIIVNNNVIFNNSLGDITAVKKGVNDGAKQLEDEAVESAKDVTPDEDKDNKA